MPHISPKGGEPNHVSILSIIVSGHLYLYNSSKMSPISIQNSARFTLEGLKELQPQNPTD